MKKNLIKNEFIAGIARLLLLGLSFTSCRKFIQAELSPSIIENNKVFQTGNTAISAADGIYYNMVIGPAEFTNSGFSLYGGLVADELSATFPNESTTPFYQNDLIAPDYTVNGFYGKLYKTIYASNAIMDEIARSNGVTESLKAQLTGEMKVVRAMQYFYLVNIWGDVPIVTSTDYTVNQALPRAPVAEVFQLIIGDLKDAQALLNDDYPSAGKARPNKFTATAFLARAYLYTKDWANAEIQASAIINAGVYNLVSTSDIGSTFLQNSSETIWELAGPNEETPVGEAQNFVPIFDGFFAFYPLTAGLISAFEPGDERAKQTGWVGKTTVNNQDFYYPFKYKQRAVLSGTSPNEHEVVLRLAEQYLIRAEARVQQNKVTDAQEDLNVIRNRAGLTLTSATTQPDLLLAIERERRVEFFAEWGHRWLDLKRTNRVNEVLGPVKDPNWQSTDQLWPIPENELIYNPGLTQNGGY